MLEEKSRSWVIKSASKVSGESLSQVSVDINLIVAATLAQLRMHSSMWAPRVDLSRLEREEH